MNTPSHYGPGDILILDDDIFFLEYVKKLISNYSGSIRTNAYTTKSEFLNHFIGASLPGLIILDYNLGSISSHHITAHEVLNDIEAVKKNVPIILISGEPNTGLLEEYERYRHLEYIVKDQAFGNNLVASLTKLYKGKLNC